LMVVRNRPLMPLRVRTCQWGTTSEPWEHRAMSGTGERLRYSPAQVVAAVDRARGDGRYFLVSALIGLPDGEREDALSQVLDRELRPDERQMVLAALARLRPSQYLEQLIETGLRSRSINVQQMTLAALPELIDSGLAPHLGEQVEHWLRRRLANPRRESTWAMWEVPGVALSLLPSYGTEGVAALLREVEPRMQPEERDRWHSLQAAATDARTLRQGLNEWLRENGGANAVAEGRDPTADVDVDRVMKRLGYRPANPDSPVYDSLADYGVQEIIVDVSDDDALRKKSD
jgi:hypothetical protein